MESEANNFIRKWPGLPRCLSKGWHLQAETSRASRENPAQKGGSWINTSLRPSGQLLSWTDCPLVGKHRGSLQEESTCADLASECRENGWKVIIYLVEVGSCCYNGLPTKHLLKVVGMQGAKVVPGWWSCRWPDGTGGMEVGINIYTCLQLGEALQLPCLICITPTKWIYSSPKSLKMESMMPPKKP